MKVKWSYSLNREPHWYTECVKWAEKTREYIDKGLNDEEAGSRAAEDIFPKYIIIEKKDDVQITYKSHDQIISYLLDLLSKQW